MKNEDDTKVLPLPGGRCAHRNKDGTLCKKPTWRGNEIFRPTSPTGRHLYCLMHLKEQYENLTEMAKGGPK